MSRLENRAGHKMARQWGDDQRRISLGGKVFADGGQIVDGWPSKSPVSSWNEGDGGSHKKAAQVFPEVFTAEGLTVRRALESMTETQRFILWAVYVEGYGSAKRGRFEVHIGRNRFYDELDRALTAIESEVIPDEEG
jgi:hypothetical protein